MCGGAEMQNPDRLLQCYGTKCKTQGIKHQAKHLLQFNGKGAKYCKECYNEVHNERTEMKKLEASICRIFRITTVGPMIKSQIKNQNQSGISLKNIRLTLEYFFEIRNNNPLGGKGIGIVPYVHEEMKSYYRTLSARRKENEVEIKQMEGRKITKIRMKPPERKFDYKAQKTINLEELANAIRKP
jgi:hypothetical protein